MSDNLQGPGPRSRSRSPPSPGKHARTAVDSDANAKRVKIDSPSLAAVTALDAGLAEHAEPRPQTLSDTPSISQSHTHSPPFSRSPHDRDHRATSTAHLVSANSAASTPSAPSPERRSLHKTAVDRKRRSKKERETKDGKKKLPTDTPETEDEDAYCVCKGANKADDTFIGCDHCDGWFHPSCMGIDEENVESLDVYICPPCEAATGKTTVYKRLCKRQGCDRTARVASKYCSPKCAYIQAQNTLASVEKKEVTALGTALSGYPSPTPTVTVEVLAPNAIGAAPESEAPAALLESLRAQSDDVDRLADLVAQRQALFAQAVELWNSLRPIPASEPAPAPKRKSKTKRRDGEVTMERQCGWDSRLLWSDEELRAWDGKAPEGDVDMEEDGVKGISLLSTMCPAGRKCERHQGWQKTLGVALDVEAAQLARKKDELNSIMERITRWEEEEAAAAKARAEVHKRLKHE